MLFLFPSRRFLRTYLKFLLLLSIVSLVIFIWAITKMPGRNGRFRRIRHLVSRQDRWHEGYDEPRNEEVSSELLNGVTRVGNDLPGSVEGKVSQDGNARLSVENTEDLAKRNQEGERNADEMPTSFTSRFDATSLAASGKTDSLFGPSVRSSEGEKRVKFNHSPVVDSLVIPQKDGEKLSKSNATSHSQSKKVTALPKINKVHVDSNETSRFQPKEVTLPPTIRGNHVDSNGTTHFQSQEVSVSPKRIKDHVESNKISHSEPKNVFRNSAQKPLNISRLGKEDSLKNVVQEIQNKTRRSITRGNLDMHVWFDICTSSIDSLRNFLLFPIAPGYRGKTSAIKTTLNRTNFGQRLFGYLRPLTSGRYQFNVSSRGGSVELWLSSNRNPRNLRIVARKPYSKKSTQSRYDSLEPIELKSSELYYVEILQKQGSVLKDHLEVTWKVSSAKSFSPIPSSCLFSVGNNLERIKKYQYDDVKITSFARERHVLLERAPREHGEPMNELAVRDVLKPCPYKPSYLIHHKLVRFQGARNKNNTRFVKIFPADTSNESLALVKGEDKWWEENAIGNKLLNSNTAQTIATTYMKALEERHPRKYELQKVVSIRSTEDKHNGERFFLNLKIRDKTADTSNILTRYVYRRKNSTVLCYPKGFRWNPKAVIHVIVPVKDSSPWVLGLIKNIEEILSSTRETKINLVLVDYGSQDMDIKQVLQQSSIKYFQVVSMPRNEKFRRAAALQKAADAIHDPRGILFLCDLHLSIPRTLFSLIRQHCVQGKMAFAPVVKRLRCGSYPSAPFGYWETLGFGLLALYKSDFDHVGGMDVHSFKQWGGEDWELLDRVLMAGIEVERLKIPAFYHFYHPALGENNSRYNA